MAEYLRLVCWASMATVVGPTMHAAPATMPKRPFTKPVTGTYRSNKETALAYPVELPSPVSMAVAMTSCPGVSRWVAQRGSEAPSSATGVEASSSTAGVVAWDTAAPSTRPMVKKPQNAELAKAAVSSVNPASRTPYVYSQLPTAVSAAVVQNTSDTTATVVMSSRRSTRLDALKGLGPSPFKIGGGGVGLATKRNGIVEITDMMETTQNTAKADPSRYLHACAARGMKNEPTPNMASTRLSAEPVRLGNIQPKEVNTALLVKL
mmetsp:Transcript_9121/g.15935  ORF Transcript_9121/g.15935 Transcript_9121/m.15935 type:complete len:264 (+) Transcript_9121:987-1778(+)